MTEQSHFSEYLANFTIQEQDALIAICKEAAYLSSTKQNPERFQACMEILRPAIDALVKDGLVTWRGNEFVWVDTPKRDT